MVHEGVTVALPFFAMLISRSVDVSRYLMMVVGVRSHASCVTATIDG